LKELRRRMETSAPRLEEKKGEKAEEVRCGRREEKGAEIDKKGKRVAGKPRTGEIRYWGKKRPPMGFEPGRKKSHFFQPHPIKRKKRPKVFRRATRSRAEKKRVHRTSGAGHAERTLQAEISDRGGGGKRGESLGYFTRNCNQAYSGKKKVR